MLNHLCIFNDIFEMNTNILTDSFNYFQDKRKNLNYNTTLIKISNIITHEFTCDFLKDNKAVSLTYKFRVIEFLKKEFMLTHFK